MDVHYPCNLNLSKQPVSRSIDPVITSIDKKPVRKSTSIVPNLESRTGNSITRYLPYVPIPKSSIAICWKISVTRIIATN